MHIKVPSLSATQELEAKRDRRAAHIAGVVLVLGALVSGDVLGVHPARGGPPQSRGVLAVGCLHHLLCVVLAPALVECVVLDDAREGQVLLRMQKTFPHAQAKSLVQVLQETHLRSGLVMHLGSFDPINDDHTFHVRLLSALA